MIIKYNWLSTISTSFVLQLKTTSYYYRRTKIGPNTPDLKDPSDGFLVIIFEIAVEYPSILLFLSDSVSKSSSFFCKPFLYLQGENKRQFLLFSE